MARILVVDDDPDIVEACQLFLSRAGHEVEGAKNRKEGMAHFAKGSPDLLILDVMMEQPDDGFTMAQDLRRQGEDLPILMLTSVANASGLAFDKDVDMVPVDDFQTKPIAPAALVQKVEALLNSRR